jgi:hypothetical protein
MVAVTQNGAMRRIIGVLLVLVMSMPLGVAPLVAAQNDLGARVTTHEPLFDKADPPFVIFQAVPPKPKEIYEYAQIDPCLG